MTAEADVCNGAVSEVAGIEEKREFKARSFQDLTKPELDGIGNHDRADDPEDSYVFVTDVGDSRADGKDMAAVDGSPRHESSAPGELLGTELDAGNGNPEGSDVGKHGNVEAGDAALDSPQHESSAPVDLLGTELDVQNGNPEGANEGKHGNEEAGDAAVDSSPQHEPRAFVDPLGSELDARNGNPEGATVGKHENAEAGDAAVDRNPQHESSATVDILGTELDARNGNPEGANVGKLGNAEAGDATMDGSPRHESIAPGNLLRTDLDAWTGNPEGGNVGKHGNAEAGDAAGDGSPQHESNAPGELLGTELDARKGNLEGTYVGKHALVNGSPDVQLISIVDGGGNQGTVEEENKCSEELNDQNAKINVILDGGGNQDNTVEEENKCSEELNDQNVRIDVVNGEVDPTLMEGGTGKAGRTDENPSVANGVLVGVEGSVRDEDEIQEKLSVSKSEFEVESEIEKAEDSKGKIERSEEAEVAKFEDQNGNVGVVAVAEPDSVKENQDYEVPNLALVADSGEEDEPKNLLSPSDKQETVEDETGSALGKEAMQDQKCDIDPENDVQYGLDKSKVVEGAADCNVGPACSEVLEGKDEGVFSVSIVQGSIMYPDGAVNSQDGNGATPQISVSEREAEASRLAQKQSAVHKPENEVQISDAETAELISSLPVDGSESESFGNEPIHLDSLEKCTISGGSDSAIRTVVSDEMEPISKGRELSPDSEDDRNPPVSAVKLEPEAHNSSAVDHAAMASEKDATSGLEGLGSFASDKGVSNSMLESADVKAMVGGATRSDVETLLLAKNGDSGNSCNIDISKASPESSSDSITKEDVSGVADVTKPFNFFVRTPRYSDEKLQEQIRIAELEVNDKTKFRDSIQAQIQEIRAKNQNNGIDHEYAKGEDRSVKKLLKEKRMEIDSLQSVINKAKNAISIEDLNSRIKTIEHMIQHETLPLKEEKQLIHEIKQLKQLREQLSSSKCSQNEIQQALEQREQAEERLKTLRKELGNLKDTASKAQTACDEAESKFNVEHKKVKELQAQFRAADDIRQEAYAKFLSLSKELSQKRKNFFKFKNDSAAATYYAFTDDRKTLYRHCVNEVENFMELWNRNTEFRSEYVRLNTRSTLRRFGTLDGRSLGPDEKPTILPSYVSERNDKVVSVPANADSISKSPTIKLKPETKIENVSLDNHPSKKETESKVKTVTTGGPAKSKQEKILVTVPVMDDEKVEVQEEPVKTKEELELIRKTEELRREEAEAKMKEQRRLEEIVKAKEARERKQRRDEKAQKREELKSRKEAEQKEKEREKKSRKKERKAASTSTSAPMDVQDDSSCITCVETSKEEASTQVSDVSTKKRKTTRVMVSKQNKTRSAPPPSLRNRNRRKWQQWMWVILISLAVLVLFWLGNLGVFSSVNSKLQRIAGF